MRSPVIARGNASFEIPGAPASVWLRRLWASPWVGNYRFNPDGTVGFFDLGCATVWTRGDHRLWIPASPSSPAHARRLIKKSAGMLDNAPFKFSPADGLAYFEKLGWTPADMESVLLAARRFHRLPRVMRLVAPTRPSWATCRGTPSSAWRTEGPLPAGGTALPAPSPMANQC